MTRVGTRGRAEAPYVATIAGRRIPRARVDERIAELRRGPRGKHLPPEGGASVDARRWIVQELVTEEILAHEARVAGLSDGGRPTSPEAISALVDLAGASVSVGDAEIRGYYERNADLYHRPEVRRVRHVLVRDRNSATRIVRRLEAGERMAGIAQAESLDSGTRVQGGYLGDVRRGELAGALEDALFTAERGAIVGPCQTEHGWHVALVEEIVPEGSVPLSDARSAIVGELLAAARARAFDGWLAERRQTLASVEPEYAHPADPVHGLPSHRH